MSRELKRQILDYLQAHNTMTLATCAGDVPWAATVFYASDDLQLYFFSSPDARHSVNLSANSRVAVTMQEDYKDWRAIQGIQLEGKVMPVDGVIEKAQAMAVYARKYADVIRLFTDPSSGDFSQSLSQGEILSGRAGESFLHRQRAGVRQKTGARAGAIK